MLERGIDVILVYVDYDKQGNLTDGELPVKKIIEVELSDYPTFVNLGGWSDGGELLFQPYLKAKVDEEYKNVDIAIKVAPGLDKEIVCITTAQKGFRYQKYENVETGVVYYIPPRKWKLSGCNKNVQEITMGQHYTTIGSEMIQMILVNGQKESMVLISKISDEEKDFYKEIVLDLISMEQQLCMDNNSSMSMAIKWSDQLYQETERFIKEFCDAFWALERVPRPDLKPFQDKRPFHKIKKISSQALLEHQLFHKEKVSAISYREDFDTFEHRVIKTYIKRLKGMVKIRQKMEVTALENERSRLQSSLNFGKGELGNQIEKPNMEDAGFYTEIWNNRKICMDLSAQLKREGTRERKWEKLEQILREMENCTLMRGVKDIQTPIRSSNLFSFHPLYQKVYAVMMKHGKELSGIDYYSFDKEDEFSVSRLSELYESWCCLKLIFLFVQNYGFHLVDGEHTVSASGTEALKKHIHNVLDGRNTLSGTRFDLVYRDTKGSDLKVSIWYDREIRIDRKKLQEKNIYAKRKRGRLRPDIILKVRSNQEERLFVLDAKYRISQNYDGIKDLCEVAFQKYTLELGYGMDFKEEFGENCRMISGSFILHSNSSTAVHIHRDSRDKKVDVEYDPKNYLGAYIDELGEEWIQEGKLAKWEVSESKFREWIPWSRGGDNNENKLGILVVNPRNNKLPYLVQMIMEEQFGLYQSRCWICGSEVSVERKYTESGYWKYYITCLNPECNKFMVETHCRNRSCRSLEKHTPLGKHTENYYAVMKSTRRKSCWNVSCPKCRQLASYVVEEFPF